MTEVLILCTYWEKDYWEKDRVAPYPKRSIKSVEHLREALPLPSIGVYTKGKDKDFTSQSPCFLILNGIEENEKGEPQFDFHFVSRMKRITSASFLNKTGGHELFFVLPMMTILGILEELGIEPPSGWTDLHEEKHSSSWQAWIGQRFQEILRPISNDEFEDRIAEIFNALGLKVDQQGHKKEGEYPDGIADSRNFAVVYDCKNRFNYFLNANDKRAMIRYVQQSKKRIEEQNETKKVYFAFIAHSYDDVENIGNIEKETWSKGLLLTSETLLYLLYRKLSLGSLFLLADFEELISNKVITIETLNKVFGR
jgi:hypothetical protein